MRAIEFITELFQPKQDINFKWSRPFKDEVNVLGKTPQGHELSVNFWEITDDIVAIDFTIDAGSDQDPDPDAPTKSGHELTRHGEEFAVFNQVVNAITQYLNKLPKTNVFFQVKRTELQREPLYVKIANRVAKQLGFRYGTEEELQANYPKLYNKFDNRYSKILWYTKDQQNVAEGYSNEKANLWIEKVYDMFPQTWQNNHIMPLGGEGDDQQFAMFELVPSNSKRDAVEVKWFQAYPLRKGVGSRAMAMLQQLAQEDDISLTLYPWDKGRVSQAKLMKFYKGQGFKPTVKGSKNMYWSPNDSTIEEAFDQPYKLKWEKGDHGNDHDALVLLPDGTYLSIMFNEDDEDEYSVEFWRGHSQSVTGEGDAQRIFSTVLSAIAEFIKNYHPRSLAFVASKEDEVDQKSYSRAKLYDRLVQRYAGGLGYRVDRWETSQGIHYELTRLKQDVAEAVPQPGASSGAPKQFGPDAKIQTKQMTVKEIIASIPGLPYYNNVVDDYDAKDYSWGVTQKVMEYATYLKQHPESLAKLPPILVLNGKFEDGAHRVSAIWLLQQRMDPKNPLWKNAKLNVQFVKQGVAEGENNNTPPIGINIRTDGDIDYASLIVDGKKKYESRKSDSLRPYVGKTVGIVRTGNGPAVAIGQVTIGEPIVVDAEKFNKLRKQHLVPQGSKFDIDVDGTKYLYPMINPVRWDNEKLIKHKGIVSRKITELYEPESSFPLHWYQSNDPREQVARAYDRKKGYIDIKFTPVMPLEFNDMVEVEFSRNDSYDMTGQGDAARVLGTVLQAFREYLKGYQPKILLFGASGDSRNKVYQNLIKRFAAGAGYKQFDTSKLSKKMQEKLIWTRGAGGGIMILTRMH